MQPEGYMSFLVRLWPEQHGQDGRGGWCGEVEHVQSGNRWYFGSLDEVLAFLQHMTGAYLPRSAGDSDTSSVTVKEHL